MLGIPSQAENSRILPHNKVYEGFLVEEITINRMVTMLSLNYSQYTMTRATTRQDLHDKVTEPNEYAGIIEGMGKFTGVRLATSGNKAKLQLLGNHTETGRG